MRSPAYGLQQQAACVAMWLEMASDNCSVNYQLPTAPVLKVEDVESTARTAYVICTAYIATGPSKGPSDGV
jgi:hypothetical protein